tara:strand:+ start:1060 stop:1203 length:144 start_codon:yes stop_codon:yes gene_type:complete
MILILMEYVMIDPMGSLKKIRKKSQHWWTSKSIIDIYGKGISLIEKR